MTAQSEQASSVASTPASPVTVRGGRGWRWLRRSLYAVLALLLLLAVVLGWALGSQSGLNFIVAQAEKALAPALRVERAEGALLGDIHLQGLRYADDGLQLQVDDFRLRWQPRALLSRQLQVDVIELGEVELAQRPAPADPDSAPPALPASLRLPLAVAIERIALGRFVLRDWDEGKDAPGEDSLFWAADLQAALHSAHDQHRLQLEQLRFEQGEVALTLGLGADAPFALDGEGRLAVTLEERPLTLDFQLADSLQLPRLQFEASSAPMLLSGEIEAAPFDGSLPLRALRLNSNEINPAELLAGLPQAGLVLEADLRGEGDSLLVGRIALSNRQPGKLDEERLPLRHLAARLDVRSTQLRLDELELSLPGAGRVRGELDWQPPQAADESADVKPEAGSDPLAALGELKALLQLSAIDMNSLDGRLPAQQLAGQVEASAAASGQQAKVALTLGEARVDADLALSPLASQHQFAVKARVRELAPQDLAVGLPTARLNLDLDARGEIDAGGQPQRVKLDFSLPASEFEGVALEGKGALEWLGERLPALGLELDLGANRLQAEGAWGGTDDVLDFRFDGADLPALGTLAGVDGLAGKLQASGRVGGGLERPSGELTLKLRDFRFADQLALPAADLDARLAEGLEGPLQLRLQAEGLGPVAASGGGSEQSTAWLETAVLALDGRLDAHVLQLDVLAPAVAGVNDGLALELRGALNLPADGEPQWRGQLAALQGKGRVALALEEPLSMALAASAVELGAGRLRLGERGRLQLERTRWTPTKMELSGGLQDFSLDVLAPWLEDDELLAAADDGLVLGGQWDLQLGDSLDGEARFERTAGRLKLPGVEGLDLQLETLNAVLRARAGALQLDAEVAGAELGSVQLQAATRAQRAADGSWGLPPGSALSGRVRLDMPALAWLAAVLPENIVLAGSLDAALELGGSLAAPALQGRVSGRELAVQVIDQGLQLEGGTLEMALAEQRLLLEKLEFVSANHVTPRDKRLPLARLTATPGRLAMQGEVALDSGRSHFQFNAERLPLLQREDRWLMLSGTGEAEGDAAGLSLNADFRTDAGYIELADTPPPSLSDDVQVVHGDEDEAQAEEEAFALRADVHVALGEALYVSALGLDTRVGGELSVRLRPDAEMAAVGTIKTIDGSYQGYGQKLTIERGVINFQGALDAPGLDILALRKGLEVEAGVAVTGSAKRPLLRLVSEPNVPDPDKLSWIVLGRAPDGNSGADMALLLPAAQALLGGPGGGMTEELSSSLGLDSFSLGQGELNSTSRTATSRVVGSGSTVASGPASTAQVLSVGKRLSPDLFLSFEQSLGGAETLAKLSYQLSRRLSAVIRSGSDNSVDLHYGVNYR